MKSVRIQLAVGLLGYLLLMVLQPFADQTKDWEFKLDRGQAIDNARLAASRLGLDAKDWQPAVVAITTRASRALAERSPQSSATRFATPVQTFVRLDSPQNEDGFMAVFGHDGRLRRYQLLQGEERDSMLDDISGAESLGGIRGPIVNTQAFPTPLEPPRSGLSANEEPPAPVLEAMRMLAGSDAGEFRMEFAPRHSDGALYYNFLAASLADEAATPEVTVGVRDEMVVQARLGLRMEPSFATELGSLRSPMAGLSGAWVLLLTLAAMVAPILYLAGALNREIRHGIIFRSILLLTACYAVFAIWSGGADQNRLAGDSAAELAAALVLQTVLVFGILLGPMTAVGFMFSNRKEPGVNLAWELAVRGRLRLRPVGLAAFWGALAGGLFAAVPYAAVVLFPGTELDPSDPRPWVAPAPWLGAFDFFRPHDGPLFAFVLLFGFLVPTIRRYIRWPRIAQAVVFASALTVIAPTSFRTSLPAALIGSVLIAALALHVHRRWGLLGVASMLFASQAAIGALSMLGQPSPSLQWNGWIAVALLTALVGLAGRVARSGQAFDLNAEVRRRLMMAEQVAQSRRAERDKLMAEFAVAAKAQQMILPKAPPRLEGYQLAAHCQPAREVGGDLYDFLPLGEGGWGLAVADVSGKGVPAALYMTLTKGLLASVSQESNRARDIVSEVNRHLYQCAKRNVFVTLALSVLDPDSGKARCVRAGHNPAIWRRAARGQTVALKPSGIGLGLAGERLFERSLTVEEIEMAEGDSLVLYSDGIPEAMNAQGDEYGDERFQRTIAESEGLSAQEMRDRVLADVRTFVDGHPASDDITLVVLKRESART